MSKTHRLFISHSWKYDTHYQKIVEWLDDASYFNWTNYSIPFDNPADTSTDKELKEKITNKIAQVNCVIVLSGLYVSYSKWIDYEIDEAVRLGKPIVGVRPWGNEETPKKVKDFADTIVGWNSSSVLTAIKEYSNA